MYINKQYNRILQFDILEKYSYVITYFCFVEKLM